MDTDGEREKSRLIKERVTTWKENLKFFDENDVIEVAEVIIAFKWSSEVKEKIRKRVIMK